MRLSELFSKAGVTPDRQNGDPVVGTLCADSRELQPGQGFVAMPSANSNTSGFVADAVKKGAAAVIASNEATWNTAVGLGVPVAVVQTGFEDALWRLAAESYGRPSASMRVAGITGTNGKTTTAWIMRDALAALGCRAAYLGTLGYRTDGPLVGLRNTTPFAVETQALLRKAADEGVDALVMEVSSHALDQKRVDGVEFDAAVFTNLTQDHLDYHLTMEAYRDAKLRLFRDLPRASAKAFRGAWNASAGSGLDREWFEAGMLDYAVDGDAALRAETVEVALDHLTVRLTFEGRQAMLIARLGGGYNVENCVSATAGLLCLGYSLDDAVLSLESATPVPGRMEAIANSCGVTVIVDYAHTPDAYERVLQTVRPLTKGRLIFLFGCGGDRDRTKRPLMAKAASSLADVVVLTSDNPRTEDPEQIMSDTRQGFAGSAEVHEIADRREAVFAAVRMAQPGDTVILAGKGHENYQIVGHEKLPWDDRQVAREALEARS